MIRFLTVAAAAAATLTLTPATAQTRGYYTAVPTTAPEQTNVVTRTTVWKCGEGMCVASKATSRDAIMCELVAKQVGELSSFSAKGKEFDAAALAKCNASAH